MKELPGKAKRKRKKNRKGNNGGQRRLDNDPLQSFNDGDVNLQASSNIVDANNDVDIDIKGIGQERAAIGDGVGDRQLQGHSRSSS